MYVCPPIFSEVLSRTAAWWGDLARAGEDQDLSNKSGGICQFFWLNWHGMTHICVSCLFQSGVSELDLQEIVERFSFKSLSALYPRLGLPRKDIEDAQYTHPSNPKEQAKSLLHLWLNRLAEKATRGKMIAAMTKCSDCRRHMNELITYWNTGRWTGDTTKPGKGH